MASTLTMFAHLQIPLEDVVKATNNFHTDNIIGHGDFGPAYKGQLLRSGELIKIAARRLDRKRGLGSYHFLTEFSTLSELQHTNLVSIIGFCDEKDEKIIVTTYEPNGSLGQFLNSPDLTWTQRLRISVGVARALTYLHSGEGRGYAVIHRFINSSTILLDENWEPKLSGFEISIKQPVYLKDRVNLSDHIGTIGYMDPEIGKTRGVTHKSDVYSFGVVLFEILCGRKAFIPNDSNMLLAPLAIHHYEEETLKDIIHADLLNQMSPQSLEEYTNVAYSCLKEERAHRPHMEKIVEELEKALKLQLRLENLVKNLEHLKIPLSDIQLATNNFSKTCTIESLDDSYTLYMAEIDDCDRKKFSSIEGKKKSKHPKGHNRTVVIKRYLSEHDEYGEEEFITKEEFLTELEILSSVKHRNVVTLLGFCFEGSEMILVTKNVSNGYLSNYLENVNRYKRILTWEKRLKICIDVAHALNYLHHEMRIIIRDICSYNIVLDENWEAKVIGFRDSIFMPPNQNDEISPFRSIGRLSHIDPEYEETNKLKRESDVYSFGVVLFEILCGRTADDPIYQTEGEKGLSIMARRSIRAGTLEKMIDPIIKEEVGKNNFVLNRGPNKDSLNTFIKIAYQCLEETQDQRPKIKVVVKELEKALLYQQNNNEDLAGGFQKLRMSLEDIKLATQNFHDDNCIGEGESFGKFCKGKFPQVDGFNSIVAKRLDIRLYKREQQFLNELQILLNYKHENVIGLVGYCDEMDEKIIVYEYASRRSLDRYLNDASLTWMDRLNICIDIASALDFLHGVEEQAKVMIHGDIKTSNILLNDDWKAKLAGFELSVISPQNRKTQNDIYSFGVVLFEILCGRSTTIHKQGCPSLQDFIKNRFEAGKHDEVVFEQIKEQIMPRSLRAFQRIAYKCLHHKRNKRPTTKTVLRQLKKALEFQEERLQLLKADKDVYKLEKLHLIEKKLEHLKIPLTDIKLATDYFSETYKFSYESWDYCTLYRVELDHLYKKNPSFVEGKNKGEHPKRDNMVLIKRYFLGNEKYGEEEFLTEIEMLTSVKHPNIVNLLGFCVEDSEMILVIENVSNGYLFEYMGNIYYDERQILTWEKRLKICIDVAHALNYLHFEVEDQKTIINRDICCNNIGLDGNWGANIYDFGLSIFLPPNQEDEALYLDGSCRSFYIDPEYEKTSKLKRESDVYSFGVVLFEILFGRAADDPIYLKEGDNGLSLMARRRFSTRTLEEMIDPIIKEETDDNKFLLNMGPNKDSLRTFIEIAYQCLAETQDERPTMKIVVEELEKALFSQKNNKDNPIIPLEVISQATQNFHDSNCIGRGGFGKVYKGILQDRDGFKTIVAKRLDKSSDQGEPQFLNELQILLEYKHENVIGLVGYCDEKGEKIIVYEYASKGSLDRYLKDASLTWVKRLNICIEVASALNFLHEGVGKQAKVIHRDIKTENILLNDDWKAKLADFGLSLISPITQESDYIINPVCGTPGYVDPLYKKSRFLTIESDIYSFGVVLFEILCGIDVCNP